MKALKAILRFVTVQNIGALIATFIVVTEAINFMTNAGPIWRDEAHIWTLTKHHSLLFVVHNMHLDSFPVIPHIILHTVLGLGMPDTDYAIRIFGFIIILAIVIAVWIYSLKTFGIGPLISMTAFALMPFMFRTFGTLRAYGMGMLFYIVAFFSIWRYLETKTKRHYIIALTTSLLSFHTLFGNVVLTGMVILAAVIVCLLLRDYKQMGAIISIGAICLLSMAVYIPMFKLRAAWTDVVKVFPTYDYGLNQIINLVGTYWYFGFIIAAAAMLIGSIRLKDRQPISQYWLFSSVTLIFILLAYPIFPVIAHQTFYEWHYAGMFLACALACDGVLKMMPSIPSLAVSVVLILSLVTCSRNYTELSIKESDIDDIARVISKQAQPGDSIIMTDWHAQCNFSRYYKGNIPYLTVLGSHDDGLQDYSKLSTWMSGEDNMNRVLSQTFKTLDSGHNVWVIGGIADIKYNQNMPDLHLTTSHKYDTSILTSKYWYPMMALETYYVGSWVSRFSYEVRKPKYELTQMTLDASQKVNKIENYQLYKIHSRRK